MQAEDSYVSSSMASSSYECASMTKEEIDRIKAEHEAKLMQGPLFNISVPDAAQQE